MASSAIQEYSRKSSFGIAYIGSSGHVFQNTNGMADGTTTDIQLNYETPPE
jgi:hypothetical protein